MRLRGERLPGDSQGLPLQGGHHQDLLCIAGGYLGTSPHLRRRHHQLEGGETGLLLGGEQGEHLHHHHRQGELELLHLRGGTGLMVGIEGVVRQGEVHQEEDLLGEVHQEEVRLGEAGREGTRD